MRCFSNILMQKLLRYDAPYQSNNKNQEWPSSIKQHVYKKKTGSHQNAVKIHPLIIVCWPPLPSHVSISCFSQSAWTPFTLDSAREKSLGLIASWLFAFSSSLSLCSLSQQPLSSTACCSLTTARAEEQHWSLYCLVTWPQSSSPGGHSLAWGPMTARGYLSGTDSPIFAAVQQYYPTNTPAPALPLITLPSPQPCPWLFWGGPKCMSKHKHRFKLTKHTDIN